MVWNVLSFLEAGYGFDEILSQYPHLTKEDIEASIAYATKLVSEARVLPTVA